MRALFVLSALFFITVASNGQQPNTIVHCVVIQGQVYYANLAKLLPDSIQAGLLIDPRKKFNMKPANVLLWMETQGWTIVSGSGDGGYIWMTKGIYLDDSARALYVQKLENGSK